MTLVVDAVSGLRRLGLGEYETRAYLALLAHPGGTGYEVAKHAGIPRAKVYETLAALIARDLVATSQDGGRVRYHPLEPGVLLRRHVDGARALALELSPLLAQVAHAEDAPALVTIRPYRHVLARARDVLATAERRAFVSGWPTEVEALADDLTRAEARGVAVYALVYGDASVPVSRLFRHHPLERDPRLAGPLPWLIAVADHAEALVASVGPPDQAVALWTRNPAVATVAAEYVKHDIFLNELDRLLHARGINLNRELAPLQAMWFDAAGPGQGA